MAYGTALYGSLSFGAVAEDEGPGEQRLPNLLGYLPEYWHGIREMKLLQEGLAFEVGQTQLACEDLLRQYFVGTATWGLAWWEREFALATDPSMSLEWRREIIRAKIRGTGTATRQMIISAAATFSGGDVNVIEYPDEGRFEVVFIGVKGIPANISGFIRMLEEIKPAHLSYTLRYTFTVWNNLVSLTWGEAGSKTWSDLKVFEE
jgi:hypothetical protein